MQVVLKYLRLLAIFTLGAVFGPLAFAALDAWLDPKVGIDGQSVEASRLMRSLQARVGSERLFMTTMPLPGGAECGYDPEMLFDDGMSSMIDAVRGREYADFSGYFSLVDWKQDQLDRRWRSAVIEQLDDQMSDFQAGFFRRCIESTVFSSPCAYYVSKAVNQVSRPSNLPQLDATDGFEDEVVCTFVDGVAAQNGVPLIRRPIAK